MQYEHSSISYEGYILDFFPLYLYLVELLLKKILELGEVENTINKVRVLKEIRTDTINILVALIPHVLLYSISVPFDL